MTPGPGERGEPGEVRAQDVHLAEDAGLLIRYPGWVQLGSVLWGEEVPALPAGMEHIASGHK